MRLVQQLVRFRIVGKAHTLRIVLEEPARALSGNTEQADLCQLRSEPEVAIRRFPSLAGLNPLIVMPNGARQGLGRRGKLLLPPRTQQLRTARKSAQKESLSSN